MSDDLADRLDSQYGPGSTEEQNWYECPKCKVVMTAPKFVNAMGHPCPKNGGTVTDMTLVRLASSLKPRKKKAKAKSNVIPFPVRPKKKVRFRANP